MQRAADILFAAAGFLNTERDAGVKRPATFHFRGLVKRSCMARETLTAYPGGGELAQATMVATLRGGQRQRTTAVCVSVGKATQR